MLYTHLLSYGNWLIIFAVCPSESNHHQLVDYMIFLFYLFSFLRGKTVIILYWSKYVPSLCLCIIRKNCTFSFKIVCMYLKPSHYYHDGHGATWISLTWLILSVQSSRLSIYRLKRGHADDWRDEGATRNLTGTLKIEDRAKTIDYSQFATHHQRNHAGRAGTPLFFSRFGLKQIRFCISNADSSNIVVNRKLNS